MAISRQLFELNRGLSCGLPITEELVKVARKRCPQPGCQLLCHPSFKALTESGLLTQDFWETRVTRVTDGNGEEPYIAVRFSEEASVRKKLQPRQKTTVVVCPKNELPAEVNLDADLGIESCSRQPKNEDCTQECAPQIQFSPESLQDFAAMHVGEQCACCGAALTGEDWYKNRLGALRSTGGAPTPDKVPQTVWIAAEDKKSPLRSACYSASHK